MIHKYIVLSRNDETAEVQGEDEHLHTFFRREVVPKHTWAAMWPVGEEVTTLDTCATPGCVNVNDTDGPHCKECRKAQPPSPGSKWEQMEVEDKS
jgi:hypothetical protein